MLRELFEQNPNIVINTDIDGILSSLLLVKYCNCNIVGFTNSKETVGLADAHNDLYANIYVDMFVYPLIRCKITKNIYTHRNLLLEILKIFNELAYSLSEFQFCHLQIISIISISTSN